MHFSPKHKAEPDIPDDVYPSPSQKELLSQPLSSGQSRINNEFEFLQHLGKGAFGDVIKVPTIYENIQNFTSAHVLLGQK